MELFQFLVEANLVTTAFVFGAIAIIITIIGKFQIIIELSPVQRVLLGLFGVFLVALSLGSHFLAMSGQSSTQGVSPSQTELTPTPKPTSTPSLQPSATTQLESGELSTPDPAIVSSTPLQEFCEMHICGELAFDGDLTTSNPLFLRPQECLSGWMSSDPPLSYSPTAHPGCLRPSMF